MLTRVIAGRRRLVPLLLAFVVALGGFFGSLGAGTANAQSAAATAKELTDSMGRPAAQKEEPVYNVVCRSLRRTTFYYSYDVPSNYNQILPQGFLLIEFDRGSGPIGIGGSKLKPGECAWLDRRFKPDEPARILIPYVAFQVVIGPGDAGVPRTLQVLYRGVWKSMSALAGKDFIASFPVRRMGVNFVVPDPITKAESPTKAR